MQRIAGVLIADFTLDVPAGDYRIELFGNAAADGSGFGEGETLIGTASITHTGSGAESFAVSGVSAATILTATTTEELGGGALGATSEFSAAMPSPDLVVVNGTDDNADAVAGDGQCDTGGLNSEGDPECTLRAAIEEVNDLASPVDTIWFDVPVSDAGHVAGVWTIAPTSGLPNVAAAATIDGSTQSGHVANTTASPAALDGTQVIVLDGSGAGVTDGLTIDADDVSVRGLVVNGFTGNGVVLNGANATVADLYIGTDIVGAAAVPNTGHGLSISGANAVVGGFLAADRVLVSGNDQQGMELTGASTSVLGTIVGLDATAATTVPNGLNGLRLDGATAAVIGVVGAGNVISGNDLAAGTADGIFINGGSGHTIHANVIGTNQAGDALGNYNAGIAVASATGISIGGATTSEGNTIAHNGGDAVQISGATSTVTAIGNSMWRNGGLGIDLGTDGPNLNDPGDTDIGANQLLNFPEFSSAAVSGGFATVGYTLDVPAGTYRVDFFLNAVGGDPSGYGEGQTLVATSSMTHAGAGPEAGLVAFAATAGQIVTASVTEDLGGGLFGATSEFSKAVALPPGAVPLIDDRTIRRSDVSPAGGLDIVGDSTAGIAGPALDFDGSTDRLVGPGLDMTDAALTIAAWVNPDTLAGEPRIVSKVDGGGNPIYELYVDAGTGEAVADLRIGGTTRSARGGSVTTGGWHYLAATWDGSELAVFVDSVEVDRIAAVGPLATAVATRAIVGNNAAGTEPFDGAIDDVRLAHEAVVGSRLSARYANATVSSFVQVGAQQTSTPGAWTTSGVQTRSGSFALSAPETSGPDAAAWAVATGIDEPGTVFRTWWWTSTDSGVDIASGTRAAATPTDEFEAALLSPSGWELRQRAAAAETTDAAAAGAPTSGTWQKVELWTDQLGDTRLFIDDIEVTGWTSQGNALLSGSLALRAGLLPSGQSWYVDDARGRKLITPEPVTSLGALDRN